MCVPFTGSDLLSLHNEIPIIIVLMKDCVLVLKQQEFTQRELTKDARMHQRFIGSIFDAFRIASHPGRIAKGSFETIISTYKHLTPRKRQLQ